MARQIIVGAGLPHVTSFYRAGLSNGGFSRDGGTKFVIKWFFVNLVLVLYNKIGLFGLRKKTHYRTVK